MKKVLAFNFCKNVASFFWRVLLIVAVFKVSTTLGLLTVASVVAYAVFGMLESRELEKLSSSKFIDEVLSKAIGGGNA